MGPYFLDEFRLHSWLLSRDAVPTDRTIGTTPLGQVPAPYRRHYSQVHGGDMRLLTLWEEGMDKVVGPMPVRSFINRFLPERENRLGTKSTVIELLQGHELVLQQLTNTPDETLMGDLLQKLLSRLLPRYNIVNTSEHADLKCGLSSPNISIFEKAHKSTSFSHTSMVVELKFTTDLDPFVIPDDHKPNIEHAGRNSSTPRPSPGRAAQSFLKRESFAAATLGQLMAYANAQFSSQFRTFTFMALICGPHARFLRWDHAGVIVTEPFAYAKHPDLFLDFFRRYNNLYPMELGYDPSVSEPTLSERLEAHRFLKTTECDSLLKLLVPHPTDPDPNLANAKSYIIERPKWKLESPFGRNSHTAPAYSLESKTLVYMKNCWRYVDFPGVQKESDTYLELHRHQVPHIPILDMGNDLGFRTITQLFDDMDWVMKKKKSDFFVGYNLFRMTVKGVGQDLESFTHPKEYANALKDALEAHTIAFEKARILHCDISAGNILITENRKGGLLIDWELAKKVTVTETGNIITPSRGKLRMGTWQYTSAKILREPKHVHEYVDDLESFLWVLIHISLPEAKSSMSKCDISTAYAMLDECTGPYYVGEPATGGRQKTWMLRCSLDFTTLTLPKNPALQELVEEMRELFEVRYRRVPTPEEVEEQKRVVAELPPQYKKPWFLRGFPALAHAQGMEALKTSEALVELFTKALGKDEGWSGGGGGNLGVGQGNDNAIAASADANATILSGKESEEPIDSEGLERPASTQIRANRKAESAGASFNGEAWKVERFSQPAYPAIPANPDRTRVHPPPPRPSALLPMASTTTATTAKSRKRSASDAGLSLDLEEPAPHRVKRSECFCSSCHRDADEWESSLYMEGKYRYFCPPPSLNL